MTVIALAIGAALVVALFLLRASIKLFTPRHAHARVDGGFDFAFRTLGRLAVVAFLIAVAVTAWAIVYH